MRPILLLAALAAPAHAGETSSGPISPPPPSTPSPTRVAPQPPAIAEPVVDEPVERVPFPVDDRVHLDAVLGVGTTGPGIGARAGKAFANRFYVGGLFVLHPALGFYLGGEGGYELGLPVAPVTIRPYLGAGLARVDVMTGPAIWTGATAHYHVPSSRYVVGGDLRIVTGTWATALELFAVGGIYL